MIKLILSGCLGKMGRVVTDVVNTDDEVAIVAGVDTAFSGENPHDYPIYSDISKCKEEADVILDFSRPDALPHLLRYAQQTRTPLVLSSTGYDDNDIYSIEYASENVPIFRSSNYALGVNLIKEFSRQASANLNGTFDIEIIEKHHNTKVDAPSGTAVMLAEAINAAAGGDLEYNYDRHNQRQPRPKREIGLHALRGGTITGEHSVIFAGPDEVVELTHIAYSRKIFALGALRAVKFIISLPCGLYDMNSLLTKQQIITHAYSSESDVLITVSNIKNYSVIRDIFVQLKESDIMIDIISQPTPVKGAFELSISVPLGLADKAKRIIADIEDVGDIEVIEDISKVTVEGSGMAHHAGATGEVIGILTDMNIPVLLITTSETKITCCIPRARSKEALAALKTCFTM